MNTSEEIKYYISQKSDTGALLVTGKWGCGKTHLIRQTIKELNNGEIKVILIADEDKITNKEKETATSEEGNTEDNEYKYSEFKEKLISRTVKIKTDYKTTIDSIINSYEETVKDYRKFLADNRDLIYCIFTESDSDNFRSVKAFITDYERIHEALIGLNIPSGLESNLFYHFGAILFSFKSGLYCEGEYEFLFSSAKIDNVFSKWSSTFELKAFQDWIVKGIWDKESFTNEVNSKFNPQKRTVTEKFLNYSIWDLSQIDIEKGMPEVMKMAYTGELNRDQLISFLQKIHFLKEYSESMPCDIDYSMIEAGFEIRKKKILNFKIQEQT